MKEIVFLLEEESAKALLQVLLPVVTGPDSQIHGRFLVFEGKQDMQKQLVKKLRGYLNPQARFIIVRDQDKEDCANVKNDLASLCTKAGKPDAIVRVACRELEAFYLGDLKAVELGLGISGLAGKQNQKKFRDPDQLHSPSRVLENLTNGVYQKVSGSRAIAPHLDPQEPRSKSFGHLLRAIHRAHQGLQSMRQASRP